MAMRSKILPLPPTTVSTLEELTALAQTAAHPDLRDWRSPQRLQESAAGGGLSQERQEKLRALTLKTKTEKAGALAAYAKHFANEKGCGLAFSFENVLYFFNGKFWERQAGNKELFDYFIALIPGVGLPERYCYDVGFFKTAKEFLSQSSALPSRAPRAEIALNLQNGVLRISGSGEAELARHSPEFAFTSVLPYAYEPGADCPRFRAFWARVLPCPEAQKSLLQHIAYALIPHEFEPPLREERIPVLVGPPASGKSTTLNAVRALFGKEDVCAIAPSEFTQPHALAGLVGKRLNICSELTRHIDSDIFKKIVSGEDLDINPKFLPRYTTRNYAKCIFAANEFPGFSDRSGAIERRIDVFEFSHPIPASERDPLLDAALAAELPGILNLVLQELREILQTRRLYRSPQAQTAAVRYIGETDSVTRFFNEFFVDADGVDRLIPGEKKVSLRGFYEFYARETRASGNAPVDKRKFGESLRKKGLTVKKSTGNKTFVFLGDWAFLTVEASGCDTEARQENTGVADLPPPF